MFNILRRTILQDFLAAFRAALPPFGLIRRRFLPKTWAIETPCRECPERRHGNQNMNEESPRRERSIDDIFAECRENSKPFNELEIADVITSVALQEPNLMKFQVFPTSCGTALAKFKIMAAANGLKKPFFTPWEKYMELSTLKHPNIFVKLASYIALSSSGKQDEPSWDGKGRVIDAKAIGNLRAIRDLEKNFGLPPEGQPSDHFIEIFIAPYFDRLKHLLEGIK
jgi:hypothetical protein